MNIIPKEDDEEDDGILKIMPFILLFPFSRLYAKNFTNNKIDLCLILCTIVKENDDS